MAREKKPKVLWVCRRPGDAIVMERTPSGRILTVATARCDACARECPHKPGCTGPDAYVPRERKDET